MSLKLRSIRRSFVKEGFRVVSNEEPYPKLTKA